MIKRTLQPLLLLITLSGGRPLQAQRYALLDEHFIHPVRYVDQVTASDRFNDLFPVEKQALPAFLKALQEIDAQLSALPLRGKLTNYSMGCLQFTGRLTTVAGRERIDYVVTSTCDSVRISLHLCDAKVTPARNAFYVRVLIRYIEENIRR